MEVQDRSLEVCDQKVFDDKSFVQRVEVHDQSTLEHDRTQVVFCQSSALRNRSLVVHNQSLTTHG